MTLEQHYTAFGIAARLEVEDAQWLANEKQLEEWIRTGKEPDSQENGEGHAN